MKDRHRAGILKLIEALSFRVTTLETKVLDKEFVALSEAYGRPSWMTPEYLKAQEELNKAATDRIAQVERWMREAGFKDIGRYVKTPCKHDWDWITQPHMYARDYWRCLNCGMNRFTFPPEVTERNYEEEIATLKQENGKLKRELTRMRLKLEGQKPCDHYWVDDLRPPNSGFKRCLRCGARRVV